MTCIEALDCGLFNYLAADIAKFGQRDVFQTFTEFIELFVYFKGGFSHKTVCIVASAPKQEIFSASDPGLVVFIVEGQP